MSSCCDQRAQAAALRGLLQATGEEALDALAITEARRTVTAPHSPPFLASFPAPFLALLS